MEQRSVEKALPFAATILSRAPSGWASCQAKHTHVNDGVAYYFASEEAKKQFAENPEKYMPQYGEFCALGVALGKTLDGSPCSPISSMASSTFP